MTAMKALFLGLTLAVAIALTGGPGAAAGKPATSTVRLKTIRSVTVTADIIEAPIQRQLNVPVRLRNLATGLTAVIDPPIVKVRARGTKATMDKLKDSSVVAFVDLDGIGEGDYGLPVRLDPAPGVGLDQLDPTIVRIHVQ